MGKMSEVKTHTAIKTHHCEWCGQGIAAGEHYRRYRYWSDGGTGTVKMHPECFKRMRTVADEEGEWFEWTPGDHERPNNKYSERS